MPPPKRHVLIPASSRSLAGGEGGREIRSVASGKSYSSAKSNDSTSTTTRSKRSNRSFRSGRSNASSSRSVRSSYRGKAVSAIIGTSLGLIFLLGFEDAGFLQLRGNNNTFRRADAELAALDAADRAAAKAFGFGNKEEESPYLGGGSQEALPGDEVPEEEQEGGEEQEQEQEQEQETIQDEEMEEIAEEASERAMPDEDAHDAEPIIDTSSAANLDDQECTIASADVQENLRVTPTFAASFPGSGARMTWNLITALTGAVTAEDWQIQTPTDTERVAAIKTHHPHPHGRDWPDQADIGGPKDWGARKIKRGMMLLRNPLDAIPSFHNYLFEVEQKLDGHSTRAPVEEWLKWRDTPGDIRCVRTDGTGFHEGDIVRDYALWESPNGAEWNWRDCAKMCGANPQCEFWTLERCCEGRCRLKKNKGRYHEIVDPDNDYREGNYHMDCIHQTNFVQELRFWERFVTFWMERFPVDDRLIISYEGFTSGDSGPEATERLANFLRRSDGLNVAENENVPCIWEKVVNYRKKSNPVLDIAKEAGYGSYNFGEQEASRRRLQAAPITFKREQLRSDVIPKHVDPSDPNSHRTGSKVRPYTQEQLDLTVAMLKRLMKKYSEVKELVDILSMYVDKVKEKQPSN